MSREILLKRLIDDLLGPAAESEISERPSDRFLTGCLFPDGSTITEEHDGGDVSAVGDDEAEADEGVTPLVGAYRPSTCGVSFAIDQIEQPSISLKIAASRYKRFYVDSTGAESTAKEDAKRANERWRRTDVVAELQHQVGEGTSTIDLKNHGVVGLELYVRTVPGPTCLLVTVALINRLKEPEKDRVRSEENTFFHVALTVSAVAPASLVARPQANVVDDRDSRVSALIYRDAKEMAVGHTCSAGWGPSDERVEWVRTEWIPTAVVRRMKADGDRAFEVLRHNEFLKPLEPSWQVTASDGDLIAGLRLSVEAYETWLGEQDLRVTGLPDELQDFARENLADCRVAAERMHAGTDLLRTDSTARDAWRLAAKAMDLQFRWTKHGALKWHPFQLGFQLLVLSSLVRRESADRDVMDLLWFPTGGGKTEAYLALTAFTIFYRRLQYGASGAGVAVLMRYTLRLLTIQQFQRAAAMVLACETIRRGHERVGERTFELGMVPFSIGLWVGGGATPNTFEEAQRSLRNGATSTPRQLHRCPACAANLEYSANPTRRSIDVHCTGNNCHFAVRTDSMPIWVVDSDVYRETPSLVIATLDKFAQIARKKEPGALFGLGTKHDPPDLIIQDELHLIAGPLGSLAGLYEVAVDRLCTRDPNGTRLRPKIIGSTATIRRAQDQVKQLFAREAFQFPPPAIDATNSGFGVQDETDPGRLYLGVSTVGRSAKFTLQATYASLLQAATDAGIPNTPTERKNPRDRYWTLTGYFNSLRELGGAVTLVMDDVLKSIKGIARRRGEEPRALGPPVELTSRVASSEIPYTLERLETTVGHGDCADVLLASNMISVGVDISRLGLMVVAAQPKTVAEYIQATSRVGRSDPGLVVVVYNHPRVRDRSFFETFPTWHRALYRSVEATSVTPFASRARDRAMHAVIVAMARHLCAGLHDGPVSKDLDKELRAILEVVVERAQFVDGEEASAARKNAATFIDDWDRLIKEGVNEYWDDSDHHRSLLVSAEKYVSLVEHGEHPQAWAAPNSMREVEPSAQFRLWSKPSTAHSRRRIANDDE